MWLEIRRKLDKWRHTDAVVNHSSRPKRHLRGAYYGILWALWVLTGTMFYAYAPKSNLGIAQGFYMAINIGYSIGWGYPTEPFTNYLWFSSFYVIFGASLVAVALGFFADKVIEDSDNWGLEIILPKTACSKRYCKARHSSASRMASSRPSSTGASALLGGFGGVTNAAAAAAGAAADVTRARLFSGTDVRAWSSAHPS